MPFVLRKISRAKWLPNSFPPWLLPDDVPADPLRDLATQSNELSVWLIDDNRKNVERVVAALAASCHTLSNVDYALIDLPLLAQNAIKTKQSLDQSRDTEANASWHVDLVELSGLKLVVLARVIFDPRTQIKRIQEPEVIQLVSASIQRGNIDSANLSDGVRQKLNRV